MAVVNAQATTSPRIMKVTPYNGANFVTFGFHPHSRHSVFVAASKEIRMGQPEIRTGSLSESSEINPGISNTSTTSGQRGSSPLRGSSARLMKSHAPPKTKEPLFETVRKFHSECPVCEESNREQVKSPPGSHQPHTPQSNASKRIRNPSPSAVMAKKLKVLDLYGTGLSSSQANHEVPGGASAYQGDQG